MEETPVDIDTSLTEAGELPNVPVCPICITTLAKAKKGYRYIILNPDTRWFYCPDCESHVGYHRMKGSWKIDPYDYTNNDKLRERIGLAPAGS